MTTDSERETARYAALDQKMAKDTIELDALIDDVHKVRSVLAYTDDEFKIWTIVGPGLTTDFMDGRISVQAMASMMALALIRLTREDEEK